MIISFNAEKTFDKNSMSIHDKISQKTRNKRELHQPDKRYLHKTTSNIILNSGSLNSFSRS